MGPEVSPVDSGNGFGTRVFWTAVIPNGDVRVNPGAGTAELLVRDLPELDYYSPDGNAALLSLGPTWQSGYFAATVSFDVVWNGPVTRRVNVRDAANGFAGTFNENQATVTWSESSTSGFTFTSNPGSFSTSVPETPGVNGVTAPLNFFAQVGIERNGIFFPQGEQPGQAGIRSGGELVPLAASQAGTVDWAALGGQVPGETPLGKQAAAWSLPASAREDGAPASGYPLQLRSGPNGLDGWAAHRGIVDHVFADWESNSSWDAFPGAEGPLARDEAGFGLI
jgi:hypothetical protein